jgi:alkylation response protein AidB-like acyl-CoA dehydrogenase
MAKYQTDFDDLYFNLFDFLKSYEFAEGMGESDLKEVVREFDKFLANEIDPCRVSGDEEGVTLKDGQVTAPPSFKGPISQYYANGWFGLGYEEEVGGIPCPNIVDVACTSLLCGANVALSMYTGLSRAALNVILKVGTDEQKKTYTEKMMTGAWGGTMCLTEPGAGSDVGLAKTTATPQGDGSYKIKGTKIFISSGDSDLYENIVHLVLARTPDGSSGTKGLSLFLVPKFKINDDGTPGETNNVKVGKIEEKMGIHGSSTCELVFGESDETPTIGHMIGSEFEGMANMFIMMNEARLLCGIQGEGQGNLVYQLTKQYAAERSQFGETINRLPDVNRMLAKMRAMGRGMRAFSLYTAKLLDEEEYRNKEASEELSLLTPVCKAFCSEEGFQMTVDAIQIHGGYGFCTEYGIEQFARDSKIATIYEGTNAIQALDFVLRKVLKDECKVLQRVFDKIKKTIQTARNMTDDWDAEIDLLEMSMKDAVTILNKFNHWSTKSPQKIMYHAYDFLMFCGNTFTAHKLLEHALLSMKLLEKEQEADKKAFYQSKIEDWQTYAQHYLTRNIGVVNRTIDFPVKFHNV